MTRRPKAVRPAQPSRRATMLTLLPPSIRQELRALELDRDNDAVSAAQWHDRADRLMGKASSMPAPIRDSFVRAVRGLARTEDEIQRRTGRLVGLAAGVDEQTQRAAEEDLRRRVSSGELTEIESEELRRRFGS